MTDKQKAILEILSSLNKDGYGFHNSPKLLVIKAINQYNELVRQGVFLEE